MIININIRLYATIIKVINAYPLPPPLLLYPHHKLFKLIKTINRTRYPLRLSIPLENQQSASIKQFYTRKLDFNKTFE